MSQRNIYQTDSGDWANKKKGNERATDLHRTQKDAIDAAREDLRKEGGGELVVHGKDGQIVRKDTIAPGNDPHPPKG